MSRGTIAFFVFSFLIFSTSPMLLADSCSGVAAFGYCGGTGSSHVSHPGYNCTLTDSNPHHQNWNDVRTIDKVWDEADSNCSCNQSKVEYNTKRTRTEQGSATLGATFGAGITAGASASIAGKVFGLAKAEAGGHVDINFNAAFNTGYTWSNTYELDLSVTSTFTADACSQYTYKKWYYTGAPTATEDAIVSWTDSNTCWSPTGNIPHQGSQTYSGAITAQCSGWKAYDGTYDPAGSGGFQNIDDPCKCGQQTACYLGNCCSVSGCDN